MTREQQRQLRELKKALPKIIQLGIKKYKLKKRDFMVWFQKKDLFFDLMIGIRERDGHCYCACTERIKPLWLDDILWDILDMPENKNEPASLRAIGAFTVYGSEIYSDESELETWEIAEMEKYVHKYIEHFYQSIQAFGIEKFYEYMNASSYHQELRKTLSLIYEKKYEEALAYLNTQGRGHFCNKGVWVNDAMRDYISMASSIPIKSKSN